MIYRKNAPLSSSEVNVGRQTLNRLAYINKLCALPLLRATAKYYNVNRQKLIITLHTGQPLILMKFYIYFI